MIRQNSFASRQKQVRRQLTARIPAWQPNHGYMLSDGNSVSMHMHQIAMEEARHVMQMKYNEEAETAAKKQKERKQKKLEAWLARQEALIRPGHVLGTGRTAEQNKWHGYVEYKHPDEGQQNTNRTAQSRPHQQYNTLVQQRMEREEEAAQLQKRQEHSKEFKQTGQTDVRPRIVRGYAALGSSSSCSLPNQTSDYFLGTGYSATQANPDSNVSADRATIPNSGNVFGGENTAMSPGSGSYGYANRGAVTNTGHITGAVSAESNGYVLKTNSVATSSICDNNFERDVEALQRKEMLESRRRLQEQYDIQVRQAADTKKQEEENIVGKLEH